MPAISTRKKLIKQNDDLFSKLIRSAGKCARCGTTENLQCAHIMSRKYLSTRWDEDNALCLCLRCHIYWWHKEPHDAVRWFDAKFPGLYERLLFKREGVTKTDVAAMNIYLKSKLV